MSIRAHLAAIAAAEVGVKETSHNAGPRIVEYQRATWLAPGKWPWCAAFVAWTLKQWLQLPAARTAIDVQPGHSIDEWRCRDALAYGWEKWARARGLQVLPETAPMLAGDVVTFDFSHIGIVETDHGDFITTIEGNTNGAGEREGDGVHRKRRARGLIRAVIRVPSED